MTPAMPAAVFTIWWITLGVTLVVFVPLAIYSLRRTLRGVRSIERYAREAKTATAGIGAATAQIVALDQTIAGATAMVEVASVIDEKLATTAGVLESRTR